MIIKKCNGLRGGLIPACITIWMSCVSGANAWQQEYIANDTKSNTSNAIHGIAITNRVMKIFSPSV